MSDIKVRVGQQNAIKVVASVSGAAGGFALQSESVVGGIASVTSLTVTGVSTFLGNVNIQGTLTAGELDGGVF